jgi:hypothetical protein
MREGDIAQFFEQWAELLEKEEGITETGQYTSI